MNENPLLLLCYEEIETQKAVEKASNSGCPGLLRMHRVRGCFLAAVG
jgi:hypothetical protein